MVDSQGFHGNAAVDAQGKPITANTPFLTLTKPADLAGTGYDAPDGMNPTVGAATGWLTLAAPVTPNETFKLRLIIYDVGDHIYDSAALIDNLRWSPQVINAPSVHR